ncbi:MAG: hypothetical protein J1F23_02960 [Oscillospiraceae bacterium]|nr:hypothetical protein [Oscillospiraceae bacterium]
MKKSEQKNEYDAIIKKISIKRKLIIITAVIISIAIIAVASPNHLEILDRTIIDTKGIHPVFTVMLVLLVLFIETIAYGIVSMPTTTSLDVECDPQKYLNLNATLTKGKGSIPVYATGYLYIGNFPLAMEYAVKMIVSGKQNWMMAGLFNKARCEFLLGNYEIMKNTVQQYASTLSDIKKAAPAYRKFNDIMILMCAIADNDQDKINTYRKSIEAWNSSKATEGFINYLKGVSAYSLDDKDESVYRFMAVKDSCEKTVLARLADEYLLQLK